MIITRIACSEVIKIVDRKDSSKTLSKIIQFFCSPSLYFVILLSIFKHLKGSVRHHIAYNTTVVIAAFKTYSHLQYVKDIFNGLYRTRVSNDYLFGEKIVHTSFNIKCAVSTTLTSVVHHRLYVNFLCRILLSSLSFTYCY